MIFSAKSFVRYLEGLKSDKRLTLKARRAFGVILRDEEAYRLLLEKVNFGLQYKEAELHEIGQEVMSIFDSPRKISAEAAERLKTVFLVLRRPPIPSKIRKYRKVEAV